MLLSCCIEAALYTLASRYLVHVLKALNAI